jgi:hypothetical protein
VTPQIAELERLVSISGAANQQKDIEEEIIRIRAGVKGEKDAAYHIDFGWKDSRNYVVIHDLRLEHNGRVAQIDHLIVSRFLECHVLETKGYSREIQITETGEWEVKARFGWKGVESPIEQNRRHIEVLKSFIKENGLAPKRLGLSLPITFHNWVLVGPGCQIRRKAEDLDQVVKMDQFESKFFKRLDKEGFISSVGSMAKVVSSETIQEIGEALVGAHRPATFNFAAKYGLIQPNRIGSTPPPLPVGVLKPDKHCQNCGLTLDAKVLNFYRLNASKLGGELLCQRCQKISVKPSCDGCGVELEQKVIAFCRFNSKRFGGKKLCRGCQTTAVTS